MGERGAAIAESTKRRKLACYFCNEEGRAFQACAHWKAWVAEDPKRKFLCAKCTKGAHRTGACREARGTFWGKPPIAPMGESVVAFITRAPGDRKSVV